MKPVIKWVGGKQSVMVHFEDLIKNNLKPGSTFYEPFAGGLAVTLALEHPRTIVNDLNSELINMYKVIRDEPEYLICLLKTLQNKHNEYGESWYYMIRDFDRNEETFAELPDVTKAARTIYLNKTCFNGLYRVNKKGYFNSPIGRTSSGKTPDIVQEDLIREMSQYLKSVQFHNGDYKLCLAGATAGDVVFLDPPYDTDEAIKSEGFVGYQKEGWTRKDLEELKMICDELSIRGCKIILTNNDTEFVRELFKDYNFREIEVKRSINRNGNKRKGKELVIYN
jgi:DNA adenine methylase